MSYRKILLSAVLAAAVLACSAPAFAQNLIPDPPVGLEGNRAQLTQKILASKDEPTLIAVIKIEADTEDIRYIKMLAAKRLAIYGTKASIPALVPMLANRDMGMYARYAMEPMPDPAVDEAFREALKTLKGGPLVGVLTSIGVRKDKEAVPLLAPLLESDEPEVVKATYGAYGYIGTVECAEVLKNSLKTLKPEYGKALCDAAFDCAEELYANDQNELALSMYDAVLASDAAEFLKEAAIYRRILALKENGKPDFLKYLHSEDIALFQAALKTVRELPDSDSFKIAQTVAAELEKLAPERRGPAIEAIADRKDAASKDIAFAAASAAKTPEIVRVSAMRALGSIGGTRVIPSLLAAAVENDGKSDIAKAAFESLTRLSGKGVDEEIAAELTGGDVDFNATTINLAKERRIAEVSPLLKKELEKQNSNLRAAAISAIGETGTLSDLAWVVEMMPAGRNAEEKAAFGVSLNAIVARMPEKESVQSVLAIAKASKSQDTKVAALDLLRTIGNLDALKATSAVATGNDAELQDEATKILGRWPPGEASLNMELADTIVWLAKDRNLARFRNRLVSAYIRLPRQFDYPEDERIRMIKQGFDLATRDEDRKLIFAIFERYPSAKMLEAAMSYTSNPSFKEDACAAAVATANLFKFKSGVTVEAMEKVIATTSNADLKAKAQAVIDKNLGAEDIEIADALRKLREDEPNIKIELVSAKYGAGDVQADVLAKLKTKFNGTRLIPVGSYNGLFGDPANGVVKKLTVTYKIDGKEKTAEFAENASVMLPK